MRIVALDHGTWNAVQVMVGCETSRCSRARKLVECAHKLATNLELVDTGVRTVVMCSNLQCRAIDRVPAFVLASSDSFVEQRRLTSASWP